MMRRNKLISAISLGAFVAVVLLALSAYADPAMLLDFANIRICS